MGKTTFKPEVTVKFFRGRNALPAVVVMTVLLAMLCLLLLDGGALEAATEEWGSITVKNDSERDVYITIDGYNQGTLARRDSHTYSVEQGSHTATAHFDSRTVSEDCTLTSSSPHYYWEISQRDTE